MTRLIEHEVELSDKPKVIKPLEVIGTTKNIALLVEIEHAGHRSKALYYPEKGVRLTIDSRIPKPFEIYHNIAFFKLSQILGWNMVTPAISFALSEEDRGSLSPFYDDVETQPQYYFRRLQPDEVWIQIAVLDYLGGLIDRTSNDILFLPNGKIVVTDNGLSFVKGVDFTTQISVVRAAILGARLPKWILSNLMKLNSTSLQKLQGYLFESEEAVAAIIQRRDRLMCEQQVI
ncbi:hypothetical protein KBD81_01065 [Candidatus Woesebacteria bacterium]|nr:hypothetical protein [Candidatus Woesebacteria bacterium]